MASLSSILAQKIPWTEKPGGLQSMGSQRVGYDCMTVNTRKELEKAEGRKRVIAEYVKQKPLKNQPFILEKIIKTNKAYQKAKNKED